jgi:predicted MFS family arabinose efflux permease
MVPAPASPVRLAAAGMIGMAVAMGIGRFAYTPILPGMMAELGLSPADAGWIASANYLGYLLGAFAAAGAWAAGLERRLVMMGLATSTLLVAAMAATDTTLAFILIRFLAGLASAFVMVFLAAIVFSHLAERGRNDLQAVHFAGVGLGIAASSVMMAGLVGWKAHWPAGWLLAAALSATGFVVVALLVDRGPAIASGDVREPKLPRDPGLTKLIVAYGIFGFGYIVTATFLVAIVRAGEGGRLLEQAVWLVTGLAALPSVYLWGAASRRVGPIRTFIFCCVVEAVGVAASVNLGGSIGPLLSGVLLGGTFVAATAYGLQGARLLAPASPRRAFALMTASFGVGQIIGPIVAGVLAERTGSYFLPSMLAAVSLLVAAALVWSVSETAPAT